MTLVQRTWDDDTARLGQIADELNRLHGKSIHRRRGAVTADLYDERTVLWAYWLARGIGATDLALASRLGRFEDGSVRRSWVSQACTPDKVTAAKRNLRRKGITV